MPLEQKGFLSKHFEKIACLAVAIGLVLSILYYVKRTGGDKVEELRGRVESVKVQLERQRQQPPPEESVPDYLLAWRQSNELSKPGDVRDHVFWYPWPRIYDEVVLGKNATSRTVRAMTGKETVPQVFIDGDYVGGSEELAAYIEGGKQAAA